MGTGSHRPAGSQRVREIQRRLRGLGYRPGPIDGIFGPRTRAAVGWFQVKHGFHVDGRATLAVVRHLRARTGSVAAPAEERPWEAYRALSQWPPTGVVSERDDGTPKWWLPAVLALLAFAIGFAAVALLQRTRRVTAAAPALPPARQVRALGYVPVEPRRARFDAHAAAIEARCADQGLALAGLVSDDDADDRAGRRRPGLAFALEQLETGEADCLVVGRLGDLTRSPAELAELLDAMAAHEAPLVVLNADPATTKRTRRWATGRTPQARLTGPAEGRRRPDD